MASYQIPTRNDTCGVPEPGECGRLGCCGVFSRVGIFAVHWECWSNCNLTCDFCYRTISPRMTSADAVRLIDVVAFAGARQIVFAGGDPSLRRDIGELCRYSKAKGLLIELQTNGNIHSSALLDAVDAVDSLALSIDSGDPDIHDAIRGCPGNFGRCFTLASYALRRGTETRVRSIVTEDTISSMAELAHRLVSCGVRQWDLQELSPVGRGTSTSQIRIPASRIVELARSLSKLFPEIQVRINSALQKKGLYAMIRSDGGLYGTSGDLDEDGYYPVQGNLMTDHVASVATALPFCPRAHAIRYQRPAGVT